MLHHTSLLQKIIVIVFLMLTQVQFAQQDPQFTQYMYNTMSVNPAYAGQRETLSIIGLLRSQWVGVDGAPQTQTLGVHSPMGKRVGLGFLVMNDALGPASETSVNGNFSYTLPINDSGMKLSLGLKGGFHLLNTDWSKGIHKKPDAVFAENLSLFSPTVGVGFYLHKHKWYLGTSVPNFLTTKHYNDFKESIATERLHYFIHGGYVFDINKKTKLKPAFLIKAVSGSPLIADLSANVLFNNVFTAGASWRWGDSVSALFGFKFKPGFLIGYAYDFSTTQYRNYNKGSHEILLRFEVKKKNKVLSPRFF